MPKRGAAILLALALAGGLGLVPARSAQADELADYELAKSRFDQGKWGEAVARFTPLLDRQSAQYLRDERLRFEASQMNAASLIALERIDEGKIAIATLLRADPTYSPTPGLYPQAYIDRVIEVRAELREELERIMREKIEAQRERERKAREAREREKKRVAALEALAAEETVVASRSRWIAAIPFGVGQFQNDAPGLGAFFATSETLTLASTVVSAGLALHYAQAVSQPRCNGAEVVPCEPVADGQLDLVKLERNFEVARAVQWASFGSTLALVVTGIIEAQVAFEDESSTQRPRELPPELRPAPTVSLSPDGAFVGLRGVF
ncbi:MAG: hypothetical protein IT373_12810 [Polyangiaceae bacterium]|nr:hypothetical protein [Polyangiaceae bacterium]